MIEDDDGVRDIIHLAEWMRVTLIPTLIPTGEGTFRMIVASDDPDTVTVAAS